MNKTLLDKIKKDLQKTGFITELEVGEILQKKDFSTYHNIAYQDKDFNISREIDLRATKNFRDKIADLYIEYHLIIEVKKITKRPWIIFTNIPEHVWYGWRILHSSFNTTNKKSSVLSHRPLNLNSPYKLKKRIGKAFHELDKKPNEKSKVFESVLSVCKAAYYFKETTGEEPFKNDFDKNSSVEIHFYIPIIVIEGILVEVYLEEKEIKIQEENWLVLEYEYASRNYINADYETNKTFFPIVVKKEYLDEFLPLLINWFNSCNNAFSKEVIKLRNK